MGMVLPATSPVFAAAPQFKPIEPVNMQEAAPPWDSGDQLAVEAAAALKKETREQQGKSVTAASVSSATKTSAGSHGSAMETWYRNRQRAAGKQSDDLNRILQAARQGDAEAQYELAMHYRNGEGGGNISQSLKWQRQSAMGGYAEAQYGLGLLYANGQYLLRDPEQARFWFQRAASQGNVAARLELMSLNSGTAAVASPRPTPVRQTVMAETAPPGQAAKRASPPPRIDVPQKVAFVKPVPKPVIPKQASVPKVGKPTEDFTGIEPEVVQQSAEQGNANAQLMLGTMYEDGVGGLPSDLRLAAHWYEKAAKQGYMKAQYNLGLLYEDGRGVNQDFKQAAYWYEKAADAGFSEAQNNLGVLYVLGNGVNKDENRAKQLFNSAAAQGNTDAERNLSMLQNG